MRLEDAQATLDRARSIMELLAREIREVSPTQALMLAYFDEPCPVGMVKHWGVNPSYNISHLCALGYFKKVFGDGDARRTVVHLTPKGRELGEDIVGLIEGAAL